MASAWGTSWGASWFNSWGVINPLNEPKRSGVCRLWLAQITAELNGMLAPPTEKEKAAEPIKVVLSKLIENKDGSVLVLDTKKNRKKKIKLTNVEHVKTSAPIESVKRTKINRRQAVSWAYNIFIELVQTSPVDMWAEEKVLQVLQQAAQEAAEIEAEDELIIEAAVTMFL
jgi:hypothetical protein